LKAPDVELFVIQCTTCRARLKVHDPALVGDIVECPKCGSFVQVTAPAGWQPPANSSPASSVPASSVPAAGNVPAAPAAPLAADRSAPAAQTKAAPTASTSGTNLTDQTPRSKPAPAPQPAAAQNAAAKSAISKQAASRQAAPRLAAAAAPIVPPRLPVPSAAGVGQTTVAASAASGKTATAASAKASTAGGSSLIVPEPVSDSLLARLASPLSVHWRIAAGGLAGLVVAGAVAWLAWPSRDATELPASADTTAIAVESADPNRAADDSAAAGSTAAIGVDGSAPAAGPSTTGEIAEASTAASTSPADEGPAAAQQVGESGSPPTDASQTAIAAEPLDPIFRALGSDPGPQNSANPGALPVATDDDLPAEASSADAAPRSTATAAGDAADSDATDSTSGIKPSSASALSAGDADDAAPAGGELDGVKQARLVGHLQDKLPAIEFKDVPLGQFVAFLSEFSTVPMAIDSESLLEVGRGAKTKVTVKLAGGTVEEALRAALSKPGLIFHVAPGRVVITAAAVKR
jgi:hypothetical protein